MQFKFFRVPVVEPEAAEGELNRFLKSVKVVQIHREFVSQGVSSFWSLAVESLEGGNGSSAPSSKKAAVDYREVLSPEDFALYTRLREWRNARADQDGGPSYVIFTNAQLAQMARERIVTRAGLKEISGVGDSRVKRYGEILELIREEEGGGTGTS